MPDPDGGERARHDAGAGAPDESVRVADLLARIPVDSPREPERAQLYVPALLRRERRDRDDAPPVPRASDRTFPRVVGAVVGLVLVCGVGVAGTAALSGAHTAAKEPDAAAPPLAGPDVVRPDVIVAALGTAAPPLPRPASVEPAVPPPEQAGLGEALDPAGDPVRDPMFSTVTTFYQTASTAPADAFGLLGDGMQAPGYESFEASWADVADVRVDAVTTAGPRAARVTVTVAQSDGTVLRTIARVVVGGGPELRIQDATLLSATTR